MWKPVLVKDGANIGDAETSFKCSLPKALITALHIRIHGTGGSAAALAYTMVTHVRVKTDGADKKPLDLTSTQLVRREGILMGIPPAVTNANGAYSDIPFSYYAGVRARDQRLMLDLRKCNKRDLELTFDAVLFNATSRFTTGTITIEIVAVCWVGAVPADYVGHIRQEEVLSLATGTGNISPYYEMPLHKNGSLAFVEFTFSAITTVTKINWTANTNALTLVNMRARDILAQMNRERHLDTALTLNCYYDFMYEERYKSQLSNVPLTNTLTDTALVISRGATTTTIVIVLGTILP